MAGNVTSSGYHAAASNVLTTELNSLADGSVTALGTEEDNSTNKYLFADFQIDLASLTISSTSAWLGVYLIPTVDGTNYPDWSSGSFANYHSGYFAGAAFIKAVSSTAARADLRNVIVPPGKFKVAIRNATGVSLASSGNTAKIRYHSGYAN